MNKNTYVSHALETCLKLKQEWNKPGTELEYYDQRTDISSHRITGIHWRNNGNEMEKQKCQT